MRTMIVVCLLLLVGSVAAAQNSESNRNESLLIALENAWNQAQLHHDSKALNELVADTFISTDNDGTFTEKAAELAEYADNNNVWHGCVRESRGKYDFAQKARWAKLRECA